MELIQQILSISSWVNEDRLSGLPDELNFTSMANKDWLSGLPDEVIHQILSHMDTKFAVQTCLLSPRWKLLWTSLPYLDFSSENFDSLPKFARFVKHVLNHRNNHTEVSSVKLRFNGAASQVFVRKIANYAYAHNVQELTVISRPKTRYNKRYDFPQCLFSSPSLKHFTFSTHINTPCLTPTTPWDFPALTTMYLSRISLCDNNSNEPVDLFSKCVNLKDLTLECFDCDAVEVFNIISPHLSNLTLIDGRLSKVVNLITPELEKLTIHECDIRDLNPPPEISSLSFRNKYPWFLAEDCFHMLNQVTVDLSIYHPEVVYTKEDAQEIVYMLEGLHSARILTLNIDIVECISAFPDLLSYHPSPFSNLSCLNIDSSQRKDTYDFEMPIEVRNFLLESSPNATFIMDLPEKPLTKKEARARRKARLIAEVDPHVIQLLELVNQGKPFFAKKKQLKEKAKATMDDLKTELQRMMLREQQAKESVDESHKAELMAQIMACVAELRSLTKQESAYSMCMIRKEVEIKGLLKKLPKRESAEIKQRYFSEYDEIMEQCADLIDENISCNKFIDAYEKDVSDIISLPLTSQANKPLTKAMREKEARARSKASLIAEADARVIEIQASVEQGKPFFADKKQLKEKAKATLKKLKIRLRASIEQAKAHMEIEGLISQITACVGELRDLTNQEDSYHMSLLYKDHKINKLCRKLPEGEGAEILKRYSREYHEMLEQCGEVNDQENVSYKRFVDEFEKDVSEMISTFQDVTNATLPLASQGTGR